MAVLEELKQTERIALYILDESRSDTDGSTQQGGLPVIDA